MAVGGSGWILNTGFAAFTITTTPKTVLKFESDSSRGHKLVEAYIGFRGATDAADEPITVELVRTDGTTAGTAAASVTPVSTDAEDASGNTIDEAANVTGRHYTAEPTTYTVLKTWSVHPQTDRLIQLPLGRETRGPLGAGLGLRVSIISGGTTPTECSAYFELED